jgi:hypothetical protein
VGGYVTTISATGAHIFVGGGFVSIEGVRRKRLAAIGADGRPTAWNPGADRYVMRLVASPDGQRLYAAGDFTNIGGAPRNLLAALSPSSDAALPFDPAPNVRVRDLVCRPTAARSSSPATSRRSGRARPSRASTSRRSTRRRGP